MGVPSGVLRFGAEEDHVAVVIGNAEVVLR
jgi:hypothetical protein